MRISCFWNRVVVYAKKQRGGKGKREAAEAVRNDMRKSVEVGGRERERAREKFWEIECEARDNHRSHTIVEICQEINELIFSSPCVLSRS